MSTKKRPQSATKSNGIEMEYDLNPRLTERPMAQLSMSVSGRKRSPLDDAQELIYDAWEAKSDKKAVELARKALTICADCADAYVILADYTSETITDAIELFEKGVKAGERALGRKVFDDHAGDFWMMLETRPYMRARFRLAETLWHSCLRYEAIGHYTELIRLNPNDNLGVRYSLMPAFIEMGEDENAELLYKAYPDDASGFWMFARALLDFRSHGESPPANQSLRRAIGANQHVVMMMLIGPWSPENLPDAYSHGDEREAVLYVAGSYGIWRYTPGAFEWLFMHAQKP